MSGPESKIESVVCSYAKSLGMTTLKLNLSGNVGWPDRLFLYRGKAFFIEFKAPGESPRLLQKHIQKSLTDQGFASYICDDIAVGESIIDQQYEMIQ